MALLPLASNATLTIDVTFTAKASAYPQATRNDVVASGTDSQNNPVPEKTANADVQIIRPAIGVAKSVASIHNNGNNTYTVVYDLVVENLGDVDLNGVQVTDNLGDTFTGSGGVSGVSVTSVGFTTNASYNGLSNTDLLAAGQTLTGRPGQDDPAHGHRDTGRQDGDVQQPGHGDRDRSGRHHRHRSFGQRRSIRTRTATTTPTRSGRTIRRRYTSANTRPSASPSRWPL